MHTKLVSIRFGTRYEARWREQRRKCDCRRWGTEPESLSLSIHSHTTTRPLWYSGRLPLVETICCGLTYKQVRDLTTAPGFRTYCITRSGHETVKRGPWIIVDIRTTGNSRSLFYDPDLSRSSNDLESSENLPSLGLNSRVIGGINSDHYNQAIEHDRQRPRDKNKTDITRECHRYMETDQPEAGHEMTNYGTRGCRMSTKMGERVIGREMGRQGSSSMTKNGPEKVRRHLS